LAKENTDEVERVFHKGNGMQPAKGFWNLEPLSFLAMFASPLATLDALRERPRWLSPLLLSAAASTAANLYVVQRIGLARLIEAAAQTNAIIDPQGAVESVLAHQGRILCFQAASVAVNVFVLALVAAKVLWLLLTLFGFDIEYKKILAVVAHANMLPAILRACMLAITAAVIQNVQALDLRNPLATNIAFFLRPASPAAFHILSSLDAMTLSSIGLLIVGLRRVCSNLSALWASLMVLVPWMMYVGVTLLTPF
jgi:hypothetical protein